MKKECDLNRYDETIYKYKKANKEAKKVVEKQKMRHSDLSFCLEERNSAHVEQITEEEAIKALQKMKCGRAVSPDNMPPEAWKALGSPGIDYLTEVFTNVMETEEMPQEWRNITMIPIFKNKDTQDCSS